MNQYYRLVFGFGFMLFGAISCMVTFLSINHSRVKYWFIASVISVFLGIALSMSAV